jgi:two-component system sensor histidine kinase MtrB
VDVRTLCLDAIHIRNLPNNLVIGATQVIRTDTRRFERIVGNLIDNANRHGDGVTAVRIEQCPFPKEGYVRVCVEDTGPGIPASEVDRLFEPFTRGEDAKETSGAGLGLAIAFEQAHLLGITVEFESPASGGSRFVIEIPPALTDELPTEFSGNGDSHE